jgi:hypothetical protein
MLTFAPVVGAQSPLINCQPRTVAVGVRDKRGAFVPSLQATDFRAKIHGRESRVVSVAAGTGADRVVLALDNSYSMVTKRVAVLQVTADILRTFPDGTHFALVVFSKGVSETIGFGHSRQDLLDTAARVLRSPGAQTALWNSLMDTKNLFSTTEPGDSVIVISDGGDNVSKSTADQVITAYLRAGIRLSVVMISDHTLHTEEETQGWTDLQNAVLETGGALRVVEAPNQVGKVRDLSDELVQYYLIQIALPGFDKQSHWKPELVDANGKERKDVRLSFPEDIFPACDGN